MAGAEQLAGKVLVDVANPLDMSKGMPPTLTVCNDDSLGESIQRAFPEVRVVKALNTVTAAVMVAPQLVSGDHTIFICGNDDGAKAQARGLLEEFGWSAGSILDLGDIAAARGMEMYLAAVAAPVGRDRQRDPQRRGPRTRRLSRLRLARRLSERSRLDGKSRSCGRRS